MSPRATFYILLKNCNGVSGGAGKEALTELLRERREFVDVLACVLAAGDTETKLKVEAFQ